VGLPFVDVKMVITISLVKVQLKDALPDVKPRLPKIGLKDPQDPSQGPEGQSKAFQTGLVQISLKLEIHANPVLVAQMLIAALLETELSVHAGLTLLVTLIQIVKLILAHKIHVVPMLYVKIRVQELFANVHQALLVTHLYDAMTIPAQLTHAVQMLIAKLKETELSADAEKDMRVTHLFNVP